MKTQVTIEVETSPFDIKSKAAALQKLAKIETEVLEKLLELSSNPKAINMFKNNFGIIKTFLK